MMNGLKTPSDMQWLEMLNEANEKANEVCSIYIDVLYFILKGRNSIKMSVLMLSEIKTTYLFGIVRKKFAGPKC